MAKMSKIRGKINYRRDLLIRLAFDQEWRCYWCDDLIWIDKKENPDAGLTRFNRATFDHVLPVSRGGEDTLENGVAACWRCNQDRGNMDFEQYADLIESRLD